MNKISLLCTYSNSGLDRLENLKIFLNYWSSRPEFTIYLYVHGKSSYQDVSEFEDLPQVLIVKDDCGFPPTVFHRTRFFNKLLKLSDSKVSVLADVDCLIPFEQVFRAAELIHSKKTHFCLPFSSGVYEIKEKNEYESILKNKFELSLEKWPEYSSEDLSRWFEIAKMVPPTFKEYYPIPLGLFFMFDTQSYRNIGGENEYLIEWGLEDHERIERAHKMGYPLSRMDGPCYHLFHKNRGLRSNFKTNNYFEWYKIKMMTQLELHTYINSWGWKNEL